MKNSIIYFLFLIFAIQAQGQSYSGRSYQISENTINTLVALLYSEQYKECIDSCKYYLGYGYHRSAYDKHPYRNWRKKYFQTNRIEDVAAVLYIGASAAYKYSLIQTDVRSIFDGIEWSMLCVNICNDYLYERTPNELWSAGDVAEYVAMGERGVAATLYGEHLLNISDDKWIKKEEKRFDKIGNKLYETLVKKLSGMEDRYSEYPLLQYKISIISTAPSLNKGLVKEYKGVFTKRVKALRNLIQHNQNGMFDSDLHGALNSLTSMLTETVIEGEICKRIGGNYERFCMENLIKLQDISYNLRGSSRYSQNPDYTLQDIQDNLEETDCAIIHFEAPIASGHYYYRYDLGTRYRNYALLITKHQVIPDLWHRGYIKDNKVNDLSKIKEAYPNVNRFYFVGTPRMSFIDIAGTDSTIVRLHSLSQLLQKDTTNVALNEVTFLGDINYSKVGVSFSENSGENFDQLRGPAIELKQIKALNKWEVRPIRGDDATRNVVASEISRGKGIVHISTHGKLFNYDDDFSPQDLVLKKNIMDNSRLILSGYNDSPESPLTSLSGSDVLKLIKIDTSIVFLDACSSGRGAVGASGSVGIAEAFHLIGAKNIICYLEPVSDEIATKFSNNFYKELANGASCHDAFFTAKKSLNTQIKVVLWE